MALQPDQARHTAAMLASKIKTVLLRGLQTVALNTMIATAITLGGSRCFWANLLYSQCIGLSIWVLIDLSRVQFIKNWSTQRRRLMLIVPLGVLFGYTTGVLVAGWLLGEDAIAFVSAQPGKTASMLGMSLVAGAVLTHYFLSREQLNEAHARAEALQRQAAESQLKLLQTQLEPHMLFNTLANLRVLIGTDTALATDMLDRLIAYLRATLQASRSATHSLQAEFERLQDYLELMAVRMGPRLHYTLDLPPELSQQQIPPLLLQPLVENAIKHGLEPKVQGGSITVRARQEADVIRLEVIDTGVGLAAVPQGPGGTDMGGGFGLAQVRERLHTTYGPQATIELIADSAHGTGAIIIFPCKNPEKRAF
jgi:signal transduction histidine kinase